MSDVEDIYKLNILVQVLSKIQNPSRNEEVIGVFSFCNCQRGRRHFEQELSEDNAARQKGLIR